MKIALLRLSLLSVAGLALVLVISACSSATPTDTPGVTRVGEYVLRQDGPELWAVVGYRFANTQLGDEWMILEFAVTSPQGQSATVTRDNVFVRAPNGQRLPVASQTEFNEAWGELRPVITRANINRDPLEYFPPSREECAVQFFVAPGGGVSFDEVTVNDRRGCVGRLFIQVPGGIQAGRWVFGIDLPESEIRVPFELGQ